MNWYLAIDTAGAIGSVAIGRPGFIAAEVLLEAREHASTLVAAVEEMVTLANLRLADLSAIIVADGPGSFTGLRIGFATVQGLVRARPDLTVKTAPSLLSTAFLAARQSGGSVASLFDALRGEVFAAAYQFHPGSVELLLGPVLTTVSALRESSLRPGRAVGDGAMVHAEQVRWWTGDDPISLPPEPSNAAALIELAGIAGALVDLPDVNTWEPDYGRPAEAQARWERAHGHPLPGAPGH